MKINRLDAHDRLIAFQENQHEIGAFIDKMIKIQPFGNRCFYVFIIHKKTLGLDEQRSLVEQGLYPTIEDTPEAFMYLQARLGRPEAQPNTTLVKVYPNTDVLKRIWTLPQAETWAQYEKGKMFHDRFIWDCIEMYKKDRMKLEQIEWDDPQSLTEFNRLIKSAKLSETKLRIPIYRPREEAPKLNLETK